jgi:hypothetical protein
MQKEAQKSGSVDVVAKRGDWMGVIAILSCINKTIVAIASGQ